jgi:hypothetical protein
VNTATTVDGAICPQDADHFKLAPPSGKGITVSLTNYSSGSGLLQLCLLDLATGDALGCSEEASAPAVSLLPSAISGKPSCLRGFTNGSCTFCSSQWSDAAARPLCFLRDGACSGVTPSCPR